MSDTLLIIDDDQANYRLIRASFRAEGMEAVVGLIRFRARVDYGLSGPLTSPKKLDGFQLEDFASLGPVILTERANSTGVRLPIEPWGRHSL